VGTAKPPMALHVKDLLSFARLALSLTDSPPLLWHFKHEGADYLGTFSVYMSWKGDIPLFALIKLDQRPGAFLAYKSDMDREECFFTDNIDDTRYGYAPVIDIRHTPDLFKQTIKGQWPEAQKPLAVQLENQQSLMRLLFLIFSKEYNAFPVWHFQRSKRHILGVCVPFEHYYEANALPVFFYLASAKPPNGPFFKYATSKVTGETLEFSRATNDTKYFYAKIIDVEDMPLFPR